MNVYNLNCDILYTVFFDSDSNSSSKNMNISFTHIFRKHRGSFKFSLFFFFSSSVSSHPLTVRRRGRVGGKRGREGFSKLRLDSRHGKASAPVGGNFRF